MTVQDLINLNLFQLKNAGDDLERDITGPGCAWVTVMANINTLAVASLTDAACVILAEDASLDDAVLAKAKMQGITLFATGLPIFDAALSIYEKLNP